MTTVPLSGRHGLEGIAKLGNQSVLFLNLSIGGFELLLAFFKVSFQAIRFLYELSFLGAESLKLLIHGMALSSQFSDLPLEGQKDKLGGVFHFRCLSRISVPQILGAQVSIA